MTSPSQQHWPLHYSLPSLRQLWYLVTVAETRHFTQAAEKCFVTQSTLSGGIQALERFLNVCLIERDRQRVQLTDVGIQVVEHAKQLLANAHALTKTAQAAADPLGGHLHIGAIPTIAPFIVKPLFRDISEEFPNLILMVHEEPTATIIERIEQGQLDLGIIALPVDTGKLSVLPIHQESFFLLQRQQDCKTAPGATTSLEELENRKLLLLQEGHCLREHTLQICKHQTRLSEEHQVSFSSLHMLIQMVASGLGVALIPDMVRNSELLACSTELTHTPLAANTPKREIALVFRPSSARHELFEQLAKFFKSRFVQMQTPALVVPAPAQSESPHPQ